MEGSRVGSAVCVCVCVVHVDVPPGVSYVMLLVAAIY